MTLTRSSARASLEAFDRQSAPDDRTRKHAAVCLLLVPDERDTLSLVLTRRSSGLRAHPGQWALPGGRLEPGESATDAGLRELQEELGVVIEASRVLGELDDYLTRSGYRITPLVVWAGDLSFAPVPQADEVASVHLVPLGVIDVEPRFIAIPESDQLVIQVPMLGTLIHAPTGAVLHQFREVVMCGRSTRVAHFEQPVFAWK